ncbi:MAG: N-acetylmuramoyl-L-alanine amidase, partial [Armatimonadetes bacterium]|nr:N-acetylmuramoyl-L-alanine amidase [Armatimonadota bacterium]
SVALRVAKLLDGKGVKCTLTRDDDTLIPLHDRPKMANALGADLFVSIHCNAMPDDQKGQRSGTELYYYTGQSSAFAALMLKEVADEIGLAARGTFTRPFVVVKESVMPAVLVELGYLDNAGDGKKLETDDFQQRCAVGIVRGIVRQLQRLPRREPATDEADTARAGS